MPLYDSLDYRFCRNILTRITQMPKMVFDFIDIKLKNVFLSSGFALALRWICFAD